MQNAVFIVGYWNSGTTLLVDVLRKHPDLAFKRARWKPNLEDRTIIKILRKFNAGFIKLENYYTEINNNGFYNYQEPNFDENSKKRFVKLFNNKYGVKKSKTLLLKNPWLWFMYNFINSNFSGWNIKKIVIIRDGAMQTASKDYWLRVAEPERMLLARAKFWVRSMEYYFKYWFNDNQTLSIRYENLCHHPRETLIEICSFLGLDYDKIAEHTPAILENRRDKWNAIDKNLRFQVEEITADMQQKVDLSIPLKK
ncbi:MAG: sulfotransferase [Bacteroidia bacterium]